MRRWRRERYSYWVGTNRASEDATHTAWTRTLEYLDMNTLAHTVPGTCTNIFLCVQKLLTSRGWRWCMPAWMKPQATHCKTWGNLILAAFRMTPGRVVVDGLVECVFSSELVDIHSLSFGYCNIQESRCSVTVFRMCWIPSHAHLDANRELAQCVSRHRLLNSIEWSDDSASTDLSGPCNS